MPESLKYLLLSSLVLCVNLALGQNNLLQKERQWMNYERNAERNMQHFQRDFQRIGTLLSTDKKEVSVEESLSDTIIWDKPRYEPQGGVINDYAYLFRSLHGAHHKVFFKNTKDLQHIVWDSTTNTYYNRHNKINSLAKGQIVMGWHPYWMEHEYQHYHYGLLSTISFFSYDIDPATGSYIDADAIYKWRTTPMIDTAHHNGVNILLTITNYGKNNNQQFLSNTNSWNQLIDSLQVLLAERNAQGIDLDFEQIPTASKNAYTTFVKKLRTELGPNKIITLQVPAYNTANAIDFKALDPFINYFILQGYDYSMTACNGIPAPVAPLRTINSDCPSISNTFDYSLRQGLIPEKTILGLPAYGTEWTLQGNSWNARTTFERYITFNDIIADYSVNYEPNYDPISASCFFMVAQRDKTTKLVWFENQQTLSTKCQWVREHNMKGVALWALGYDGVQPQIWNAIASNFGKNPLEEVKPIGYDNGQLYSIMAALASHRRVIGVAVMLLVSFFVIGLAVSLFDWRVREVFFRNYIYRVLFSGVMIVLALIAAILIGDSQQYIFPLMLGLVIGAVIVYIITMKYVAHRKKMP